MRLPDLNRFHFDKVAHFVEFLVISFLSMRAIMKTWCGAGIIANFVITIIFVTFFAYADERHQIFVANRTCSFYDLIFDYIGAAAGILIFTYREEQDLI
ncbi:MAG: VanZ family protein [Candidatus Omnitrophica bacterium]|nr:VanZ family protein [Candidatus Omnitrophota bacterium]MCM8791084.1 VanZ family protein [Candidatus Omnitrophota bacterium]